MNIFNAEIVAEFFRNHYFLFLTCIVIGTFVSVWYIIPKIIWVSNEKQLTKPVIERSVHVKPIPTLGGVAFFVTLILALALIQSLRLGYVGNHLIAALTILFMVGLKDDLVVSTARVKFIGQFLAVAFLIFSPELEIFSLNGFLGIHEIPAFLGYFLAAFVLLAIVNSYNLIDGIDGLAAGAGIIIGSVYAALFYLAGEHFFVLVSLTLVGMLAGFLRYNFSRGERKIFMGDSGALIIGLVIGFLTLKILSYSGTSSVIDGFVPGNRILVILAVLFIPFFDTSRSIIIRLLNKKSPFAPDRNHTHHVLIDAGFSHKQATLFLGILNILVVGVFLVLSTYLNSWLLSLTMLGVFGICCWGFNEMKKAYPAAVVAKVEPNVHGVSKGRNGIPVPPTKGVKIKVKLQEEDRVLEAN